MILPSLPGGIGTGVRLANFPFLMIGQLDNQVQEINTPIRFFVFPERLDFDQLRAAGYL